MQTKWLWSALVALVLAGGGVLLRQHQIAEQLRLEIALQRDASRELARLRVENQRLLAGRIAPDELEALRADHVAVLRLRGETEAMQRRIDEMTRRAQKISGDGQAK